MCGQCEHYDSPDPRVLCAVCRFPPATVEAVRLAGRLAQDVRNLASLVTDPKQAQRVQAIAQSASDQALRLLEDLPTADFFDVEENEPESHTDTHDQSWS